MKDEKLHKKKHSDGNWIVVPDETHTALHQIWNDLEFPTYIAKTCYALRSEANARLIAAAPDMLQSLKDIVKAFSETLMCEYSQKHVDTCEEIQAAIKAIEKATDDF